MKSDFQLKNIILAAVQKAYWRGTWVIQSVKRPTPDLSSGLDLRVMTSSPVLGSVLGVIYLK